MMKSYPFLIASLLLMVACVPARKFEDLSGKYDDLNKKNDDLQNKAEQFESKFNELELAHREQEKSLLALEHDTTVLGNSLRKMTRNYDQLDKTYRELLEINEKIRKGSERTARDLSSRLDETRGDLQKKEDQLKEMERDLGELETNLNKKEASLQTLQNELMASQKELEAREGRVRELEGIINRKDSMMNALKDKVSKALLGFENNGLTVQHKNGKVYVSLENQLLFRSGSYTVDAKGKEAIKKLAKVLEENQDINVMVEGHTDTDKYKGSGALKDNWDLSVIRATQIVKILTKSAKVDPKRITAAGRGEFLPLDSGKTPEAKRTNRRTEIILTPRLDELFDLLQG